MKSEINITADVNTSFLGLNIITENLGLCFSNRGTVVRFHSAFWKISVSTIPYIHPNYFNTPIFPIYVFPIGYTSGTLFGQQTNPAYVLRIADESILEEREKSGGVACFFLLNWNRKEKSHQLINSKKHSLIETHNSNNKTDNTLYKKRLPANLPRKFMLTKKLTRMF